MSAIQRASYSFQSERWKNTSEDAKDLISKMLVLNPQERLTAAQAYQHPWVEKLAPNADNAALPEGILDSLKGFQVAHKLEKAALTVMALQLSDDAVKHLRAMFTTLDKDGSGMITSEELKACIADEVAANKLDAPLELQELMEEIDTNGNKAIDYTEFLVRMERRGHVQEDVCWAAFRVFDLDGSGAITIDELAVIISGGRRKDMEQVFGIERDEIERIVKATDLDGNGKIDFDEFMKMMQRAPGSRRPSRQAIASSR